MGCISKYLGDAILNEAFRDVNYVPPTTVYLGLYTSDPGDTNTGTEVSNAEYARQVVAFDAPTYVGGKSTILNTLDVVYPIALTSWGTVTHVGVLDALTGGHLLYYGSIPSPGKLIGIGDQFKTLAGNLSLDLD